MTYYRIQAAIKRASKTMASASPGRLKAAPTSGETSEVIA
jgi:hypothetical protein